MPEYIDKALLPPHKEYTDFVNHDFTAGWNAYQYFAYNIPAADVVERPRWIPVKERLPESGVHVLLACKTWGGNKYVCDGFHTEKFSQPTEFYEDIDADYSEETDEYYFPEGWWEVIKNWDDYSCVAIEDTVTHWMPLPPQPDENADGQVAL